MNRSLASAIAAALVVGGICAWFALRPEPDSPARVEPPGSPPALIGHPESKPATRAAVTARHDTERPATRPSAGAPAGTSNAVPPPQVHQYFSDRAPDEVLPDGTHVYHNYPFKVKQPDGTYQIVPVTVTMKPVPVAPADPAETGGVPKKN